MMDLSSFYKNLYHLKKKTAMINMHLWQHFISQISLPIPDVIFLNEINTTSAGVAFN